IRKEALAARPAVVPARGVATSRYPPGVNLRPDRRPVNRKLLVPALPWRLKLPGSITTRVQVRARRLDLVGLTQRPLLALRPTCIAVTVKRTRGATLSV